MYGDAKDRQLEIQTKIKLFSDIFNKLVKYLIYDKGLTDLSAKNSIFFFGRLHKV